MIKKFLIVTLALVISFSDITSNMVTAQSAPTDPETVARLFFDRFSEHDHEALAPLFADWAVYCKMRQINEKEWDIDQFNARKWLNEVIKEVGDLPGFRIDVHELAVMMLRDDMAAVSVTWAAYVGDTVANEGIDVLSMIKSDDTWLIVQYSALEKFTGPDAN